MTKKDKAIELHNKKYNCAQAVVAAYCDIYGMDEPYYYRNKVQYPMLNRNGRNYVGMYEKGSHDLVNNKECFIQDKFTHNVARRLFELLDEEIAHDV